MENDNQRGKAIRKTELQLTSLAFLTERGIGRVELRCRQNRWQRQMTTRELANWISSSRMQRQHPPADSPHSFPLDVGFTLYSEPR